MELDDTLRLGAAVGAKLRGGEVFELRSDLGGGKTAFVRGLAQGMGSYDNVHSPSFTISNQYETGTLTLYHFDFYRLKDPGVMRDELTEAVNDQGQVVAVEWADIVEDVLPAERITLIIKSTGETEREFTFQYPDKYDYLFPDKT
jgi:tRNA threonylcarbamoyladenosine biosynthesis protein TsaE